MATLREIIYSIKEVLNAYSDDSTLSNEHLAFLIRNKRATYLELLAANPRKQMPKEAYQRITFKLSPDKDCEDGMVILKSLLSMPAVLNNPQDIEGIQSVKLDSVMAKWINIVPGERLPFLAAGRFIGKQIYVSVTPEDKIILFSQHGGHVFIDEIKVNLLAEDPEAVDAMIDPNSTMDFYDKNYPIPESLIKPIVDETANELLTKFRLGQDSQNNGADDTLNQKIPYYGPRRQQAQQRAGEEQAQ